MDALCIDFINSEFRDFRGRWVRDDLLQQDWREQFLTKWGLQVENPPDEATLAALLALRTLLAHMIETLADGRITENDRTMFNAVLLKSPFNRSLEKDAERYRIVMLPQKRNWDWVQAEIAASFAHLLIAHDPTRIKLCANPYCRGAFYDETKSRTQRYCTADKCANLMKARRYRVRHKADMT
ncbi:MAG TPA: hypothetical protein DHW02_15120 [Ktedonobacter sp.]|nr:hypothetical protein [Ktedonobacter sp.]